MRHRILPSKGSVPVSAHMISPAVHSRACAASVVFVHHVTVKRLPATEVQVQTIFARVSIHLARSDESKRKGSFRVPSVAGLAFTLSLGVIKPYSCLDCIVAVGTHTICRNDFYNKWNK